MAGGADGSARTGPSGGPGAPEVLVETAEGERSGPGGRQPTEGGLVGRAGTLSILFGGGKGKKGAAGAEVKAGAKGDTDGKTGGTALAKASKKLLLKMIKALMKLGVKVTFWTLVAFVVAVALVPLSVMSVVYWLIARRAYRWGSVPWLRGLVLLQLQGFAVLTGFWCLFAPLPVLFGHFLAGPFVVAGAAALVPPSLLLVRAYRREPLRFPVAVHTMGPDATRPLTLAGLAGLVVALFVGLGWDVLCGEAIGFLSLALVSVGRVLVILRGSRLARRLWLPPEVVPIG
ncbi:hypothetical protein [Methanopyrus kandleri]